MDVFSALKTKLQFSIYAKNLSHALAKGKFIKSVLSNNEPMYAVDSFFDMQKIHLKRKVSIMLAGADSAG